MNHASFREMISALHDGELDAPAAETLRRHLDGCAECRMFASGLRALSGDLRTLDRYDLPVGFSSMVTRRVTRTEREVERWVPVEAAARRFVAGLATAVVIFVSVAMVVEPDDPVVIEPYLAGDQADTTSTRVLLANDVISKDDVLFAAVTRK